ncbi:17 domain protein [Escherichia phage YDC107_2]|nr:17 domain protein [Escherichia phage YDC107_2]
MSQQLNDLASGRNPREMTGEDAAKFWLGALLKGGGLGLYGDFYCQITLGTEAARWRRCLAR